MPDKQYVGLGKDETTSMRGIAKRAKACRQHRFQNVYRMIDEKLLLECWSDLNKKAASGVDGVTAEQYEANLAENILNLLQLPDKVSSESVHSQRKRQSKAIGNPGPRR